MKKNGSFSYNGQTFKWKEEPKGDKVAFYLYKNGDWVEITTTENGTTTKQRYKLAQNNQPFHDDNDRYSRI